MAVSSPKSTRLNWRRTMDELLCRQLGYIALSRNLGFCQEHSVDDQRRDHKGTAHVTDDVCMVSAPDRIRRMRILQPLYGTTQTRSAIVVVVKPRWNMPGCAWVCAWAAPAIRHVRRQRWHRAWWERTDQPARHDMDGFQAPEAAVHIRRIARRRRPTARAYRVATAAPLNSPGRLTRQVVSEIGSGNGSGDPPPDAVRYGQAR